MELKRNTLKFEYLLEYDVVKTSKENLKEDISQDINEQGTKVLQRLGEYASKIAGALPKYFPKGLTTTAGKVINPKNIGAIRSALTAGTIAEKDVLMLKRALINEKALNTVADAKLVRDVATNYKTLSGPKLMTQLKKDGFADDVAQKIAKEVNLQNKGVIGKTVGRAAGTVAAGRKYTQGQMAKYKGIWAKLTPLQQKAIKFGTILTAGGVTYLILDKATSGTGKEERVKALPTCILNLKNSRIDQSNGKQYAYVGYAMDKSSINHKGVYFWDNGYAITGDRTMTGKYDCGGQTTEISEQNESLDEQEAGTTYYPGIKIYWSNKKTAGGDAAGGGAARGGSIYKPCDDFPFEYQCKNEKIKEIQVCLGFPAKHQTGNFGPITQKALTDKGYDLSNGITEDIYNKIKSTCAAQSQSQTTGQGLNAYNSAISKNELKYSKLRGAGPVFIMLAQDAKNNDIPTLDNYLKLLGFNRITDQNLSNNIIGEGNMIWAKDSDIEELKSKMTEVQSAAQSPEPVNPSATAQTAVPDNINRSLRAKGV